MREVAEQSVQVGDKLCVVGKAEEARTSCHTTPHSHLSKWTSTTLPDMLKPAVPGDEKGRDGGGGRGDILPGTPSGVRVGRMRTFLGR